MRRGLGFALAAVTLAGAPSLWGGFLTDDHQVILHGRLIHSLRNLREIWTHDTMWNSDLGSFGQTARLDTYRPLTMTTFVLEYQFWGRTPFGYHLTNLLLHLACAALVWFLALRATGSAALASVAAVWLGIHPVTAEAWAWINGRSDLIATFMLLATLWTIEQTEARNTAKGPLVAIALLGLGACLSKETAAVGLMFCAIRPRCPTDDATAPSWRVRRPAVLCAVGLAVAAYLALRMAALDGIRATSGLSHLSEAARALPTLLGLGTLDLLVPLHSAPRFFAEEIPHFGIVGASAVVVLGITLAASLWRWRHKAPWLVWAILGYVACVAPGALTVVMGWDGQGRYFYLPIAIVAAPLTYLACGKIPNRRLLLVAGAAYGVSLIAQLQATIASLDDDEANGRAAIEEFPKRSHGYARLGVVLCARGDRERGRALLEKAIMMTPGDGKRRHNLALCTLQAGHAERALQINLVGQELHPGDTSFHIGAALSRAHLGDISGALAEVERGLGQRPAAAGLVSLRQRLLELSKKPAP